MTPKLFNIDDYTCRDLGHCWHERFGYISRVLFINPATLRISDLYISFYIESSDLQDYYKLYITCDPADELVLILTDINEEKYVIRKLENIYISDLIPAIKVMMDSATDYSKRIS